MVEKNPLVTIIIPFYNAESYLQATMDSALNQTWGKREIILVDDGSTDRSNQLMKDYLSKNIKLIRQQNRGASAARNYGIRFAEGDLIQFLDSDDILAPDKIERQVISLRNEPDGTVASGPFRNFIESVENPQAVAFDNGFGDFEKPVDWLVEAALNRAMFPPVVWLTPRKLIEEAGAWNENITYNDDSEFFARVLLKARKIVYCNEALSYYRRGVSTSLGSRKDRIARISELYSLNLVTSHMLNHEPSLRVREACAYKYRKLIYSLYPEHRDLIKIAQQKLKDLNVRGDFNFGNGLTRKLSNIIGWKNAKLIQMSYKKIRKSF
jgi:glycosyltransferase involved in cell wall biosynthesis